METIYLICINSMSSRLKGRAWRRWHNFKRTMARAINRWVYRVRRINQPQGMVLCPAINEREGLDLLHSDRVYQTAAEKRENKRVARRFFEVEFGWEG